MAGFALGVAASVVAALLVWLTGRAYVRWRGIYRHARLSVVLERDPIFDHDPEDFPDEEPNPRSEGWAFVTTNHSSHEQRRASIEISLPDVLNPFLMEPDIVGRERRGGFDRTIYRRFLTPPLVQDQPERWLLWLQNAHGEWIIPTTLRDDRGRAKTFRLRLNTHR